MAASPQLEVRHKGQQSADSGAYLEWGAEEAPMERPFNSNVTGEFVTVVAVEQTPVVESPFVTVLSIGDEKKHEPEEVLVYRLPGERLGFGLKFEGGLKTAERVNRLFIQSCAPDSPASRTRCSWGPLAPGDEILEIDGVEVKDMTRIDCVRSLKESNVVIKLKVKQQRVEEKEEPKPSSPPPIPPRKVPRRNSSQKEPAIVNPPDGFADDSNREAKAKTTASPKSSAKNNHEDRHCVPEAEVYLDLIAKESEILPGESESDDTGSSISTVVDRLSSAPTTSNSSFSDVRSITSLDITTPPTPTTNTCPTFDLDRVLEPFLQLEREFSSSAAIDESSLFNKLVAAANFTDSSHISVTRTSSLNSANGGEDPVALQPPVSFQDEPGNRANFDGERHPAGAAEMFEPVKVDKVTVLKASPRKSLNIVLNVGNDQHLPQRHRLNSQTQDEDEDEEKDAPALPPKPTPRKDLSQKNKFKSGKKRPPPPPPPRSDRPLCPDPQDKPAVEENAEEPNPETDESRNEPDHHLPRLIDFVPKDRTDLVVPNAIHPENSQQSHMELLIQRQRMLEMVHPLEVQGVDAMEEVLSDGSEGEGDEHCATLPMCVPAQESDEESDPYPASRGANLTTIGEDEEDRPEEAVILPNLVPTIEEPTEESTTPDEGAPEPTSTHDKTESSAVANVAIQPEDSAAASDKSTEKAECGAMDASATASLSLSPPPSFSRLPPDGHEFPPNYQETCPEPAIVPETNLKMQPPPPLPSTAPPIHKKKLSVTSIERDIETSSPTRKFSSCSNASSTSAEEFVIKNSRASSTWRNDEKSVRSVRDKIAMFSNITDETPISPAITPPSLNSHRKLNRFKSSEDVFYSNDSVDASSGNLPSGRLFSKSVMSVDKVTSNSYLPEINQRSTSPMKKLPSYSSMVDMSQVSSTAKQTKPNIPKTLDFTSRTQSSMDLSSSSSAYSSESPDSSLTTPVTPYVGYSSTLPRKTATREQERKVSVTSSPTSSDNKTSLGRAMSFNGTNKLHSRSQSLVDVNTIPSNKYIPKNNSEEARRASLNALIEQRRRSISKLRGLVIPEKVSEDVVPQTIPDLPEIKSRESILAKVPEEPIKKSSFSSYGNSRYGSNTFNYSSPAFNVSVNQNNNISSLAWKTQPPVADIPKYSPAFKRKSLAVYGAPSLASSVSSSLSSSREELRPIFDNHVTTNSIKTPPPPPSKPPRTVNNLSRSNFSSPSVTSLSPTLSHHEPPKSLESITSPTQSDLSFEFISSSGSSPDIKMMRNNNYEDKISQKNGHYNKINEPQVMPFIKKHKHLSVNDHRRSGGEESDNDSAVSSSRSSISHDFSPPQSPIPDMQNRLVDEDNTRSHMLLSPSNSGGSSDRRTLRRTLSSETTASAASSTASTLTSGSQASCSSSSTDSLNRRVLKAQSVEAINRKNVLSSARFSSGQDLKIGSPLIQRKFDETEGFENDGMPVDLELHNETKTQIETDNFIEKLNGTLKKDVVTQELQPETDSSEIIHYQISPNNERTTKVAYLEVEVSDCGNFSSQDESSYLDSNPSSMEHLDSDPIPAIREKCQVMENGYLAQEIYKTDSVDGKMEHVTKRSSIHYNINAITDLSSKTILDNSPTKKPFIKRLSRESFNNNGSSTSDDDSCKTADSQNNIEVVSKQKSVPVVPPKPAERKNPQAALIHSNSKESSTSSDDFISCTSKQDTPTLSPKESPTSSSTGKIPTVTARNVNNRRSVSVNDIRKAFEKAEIALSGKPKTGLMNGNGHLIPSHARVSSLDSTTSEDSCAPTPSHYGSVSNLQREQQFGSITSLASSTSLISQQELQQLIEDANQALEETGGCSHEVVVVILHRDTAGGSVGITLAGGADYEAKEITVHKVLAGSPADRDGRIQKGDRILSINGRSMKGVSHRESLAILKAPRPEVVLVVSRWRPGPVDLPAAEDPLVAGLRNNTRPPRIPEQPPTDAANSDKEEVGESEVARGPPVTVTLVKDGAGLGFSLEGGKDSPLGDQPLTIKKIFTGGCAEKSGQLFAGDELLSVNGTDVTSMSRIEAWGLMKRLADGKVVLTLRHKTVN